MKKLLVPCLLIALASCGQVQTDSNTASNSEAGPSTSSPSAQKAGGAAASAITSGSSSSTMPTQTVSMTVACGSTDVDINAAETALASSGGIIDLQACTYVLNNPITLRSGVSIQGVAATKTTTNALIGGGDVISGGTILVAGAATQAMTANTTGTPTWPHGTISGVEIGNISFKGFSGGGIVIGANGNGGASFSNFHDLDFYQCGSQSAIWAQNRYSMSIENFATITVERVYAHSALNGFQFLVGNNVGDELGNSQFTDMLVDFETESTAVQPFVHAYIFGSDPSATGSTLNEIKAYQLAAYGFNRPTSGISDTATFSGGTKFRVATGSNFPVGMPVLFMSGAGNVRAEVTYFVQSQTGNTLSIGSCRSIAQCPALALPSSGTLTIKEFGFPLLDLGGVTPSASLVDSQFTGLDLEGPVDCSVYMENVANVAIGLSQANAAANGVYTAGLCTRKSSLFQIDSPGAVTQDNDGYGYSQIYGAADQGTGGVLGDGIFNWYPTPGSGANSVPSLNIGGGYNSSSGPDIQYRGNAYLYPNTPIGERINSADGAGTPTQLAMYQSGFYSLDQSTTTVYYIPYLVGNTAQYITYNLGQVWEFFNQGTGTAVVQVCNDSTNRACTGGQNGSGNLFNNRPHAKNQLLLLQGQSARLVSAQTGGGVNYWAVVYTNGTID